MRDWFTKDPGWKLFSIFLAVTIWLTVHKIRDEPEVATTAGVPNTYGNVPVLAVSATADVQGVQITPNTVTVRVSGAADLMAVLQASRLHAVVNLTSIDAAHSLRRHVDVAMPPGVTLVSVEPPDVNVTIPPAGERKP